MGRLVSGADLPTPTSTVYRAELRGQGRKRLKQPLYRQVSSHWQPFTAVSAANNCHSQAPQCGYPNDPVWISPAYYITFGISEHMVGGIVTN